jgi:hypothetical protein
MSEMRRLLERAQPGSRGGVSRHIERGEVMRELIAGQYPGIVRPEQWRAKHLRWVLEGGLSDRALATQYDYWRSARVIAAALGRWGDWEPHLRGPWCRPDGSGETPAGAGGRPAKLAHRARSRRRGHGTPTHRPGRTVETG